MQGVRAGARTAAPPARAPGVRRYAFRAGSREPKALKTCTLFWSAAVLALTGTAATAQTLQTVQERGTLICGVSTGMAGFSAPDANGIWQGFDVALCRAVAAAVLGDPTAVTFVPTDRHTRFPALASGRVDLLARNTALTFSRDVGMNLSFAGISYYDGQGFLIGRELGIGSALDLDGATICVPVGTTAEQNLADYFAINNLSYEPLPVETTAEAQQQYLAGACDVYTYDISALAATRASLADPENHMILPQVIAKAPLGPVVRDDDRTWEAIVRWTLYALIAAEEYGVTSANIAEFAQGSGSPQVNRLLGVAGNGGAALGLDAEWAVRAISAAGNYGEIFATTVGEQTPIGLPRGLNALWTQGGLMYAPPFL